MSGLEAIEDAEVVQVLRSRVVPSVKLALQPDRDAGHIPAGDAPHNQLGRRVSERGTVEALLDTVTIAIEPDRVKVNPPAGTTGHLQAHGKPVGLFGEPHRLERSTSHPKRVSVDRQVEVAVLAGRSTVERVDSPASAAEPVNPVGSCSGLVHWIGLVSSSGRLIQAASGRFDGTGGLRTNRCGVAV